MSSASSPNVAVTGSARIVAPTILIVGPVAGPAQAIGSALARAGATCVFADSLGELQRAGVRTAATAVLIDAAVFATEGAAAVHTIAAAWPKARRIVIGGWPPVSPEKVDFHISDVSTPQAMARAVAVAGRLSGVAGGALAPAVLVIDDMRTMRELAAHMLDQEGFATHAVASFEEAFAYLERVRFSAVVSDVFMSGIGGIEGISSLRSRAPDLAIVAMSGGLGDRMGKGSALVAAVKIGAHRAVSKPFQPADLVGAVRCAMADVAAA